MSHLTKRALEIFCTVVEEGSMVEAARKLYISQPSVSNTISKLEVEYGVTLFDRMPKALSVTYSGRLFYKYAQSILELYKKINYLGNENDNKIPVTVGATSTVGNYFLIPALKQFEESHPTYRFKLLVSNTDEILRSLLTNEIDFAIVETEFYHPEVVNNSLFLDELKLVSSLTHPLAEQEVITVDDLQGKEMVFREEGSGMGKQVKNYLVSHNIHVEERVEVNSVDSIIHLVGVSNMLAFVSEAVAEHHENIKFLNYNGPRLTRNINLVHLRKKVNVELFDIFEKEFLENFSDR